MEAVDLLVTIMQLGDQVLALARRGRLPRERAEVLLLDLKTCFAEPITRARRVGEIGKELRGCEK